MDDIIRKEVIPSIIEDFHGERKHEIRISMNVRDTIYSIKFYYVRNNDRVKSIQMAYDEDYEMWMYLPIEYVEIINKSIAKAEKSQKG